jgi:hypothetical protein
VIKTVFINLTIRKPEPLETETAYRMYHAMANQKFEEQQNDLSALLQDGWTRFADGVIDLGVEKSLAIVLFKPDAALAIDAMLASRNLVGGPKERAAADFIEAMYDDTHDPEAGLFKDKRTDRELLFDFIMALTGEDHAVSSQVLDSVKRILTT